MKKLAAGDRVWYDDNPGTFTRMMGRIVSRGAVIITCEVMWDNGTVTVVDRSDLLTDAEHADEEEAVGELIDALSELDEEDS